MDQGAVVVEARFRVLRVAALGTSLLTFLAAVWRGSEGQHVHAAALGMAALLFAIVWLGLRRSGPRRWAAGMAVAVLTLTSGGMTVLTGGAALGPLVALAVLPVLATLLVSPRAGGMAAVGGCLAFGVAAFLPARVEAPGLVLGEKEALLAMAVLTLSFWSVGAYYEGMRRNGEARFAALRAESERTAARFRAYAENARDIVAELAEDGTLLYASPGHEAVLGRPTTELLGRAENKIVHPEDLSRVEAFFREVVAGGGEKGVSARYVRPDGTLRWLQLRGRAYENAEGEGRVVLFAHDVTPDREAAKERDALIARLQDALESVETLRGIVPICAECKMVRREDGAWEQIEAYVADHSLADFSHGLCERCLARHDC